MSKKYAIVIKYYKRFLQLVQSTCTRCYLAINSTSDGTPHTDATDDFAIHVLLVDEGSQESNAKEEESVHVSNPWLFIRGLRESYEAAGRIGSTMHLSMHAYTLS